MTRNAKKTSNSSLYKIATSCLKHKYCIMRKVSINSESIEKFFFIVLELHTCKADALLLEPHQLFLLRLFWKWRLAFCLGQPELKS
jgi:hypothetical protein